MPASIYPKAVFSLYIITCALLAVWKLPFAPVIAVAAVLIAGLGLYWRQGNGLGRILIGLPVYYWVFVCIFGYWLVNFLFIARVPVSDWLSISFFVSDGKIFLAYAPLFIVPIVFYRLKTRQSPKFGLSMFLVVSLVLAGLGIIQYWLNTPIPGLDARQQFVLFGGSAGRVILGGLLQQNAAAAFYLLPGLYMVARFAVTSRKWWFGVAAALFFVATILTISRSGVIGLSIGASVLITLLAIRHWEGSRWRRLSVWFVAMVGVNALLFMATQVVPAFQDKISQIESAPKEELSTLDTDKLSQKELDVATSIHNSDAKPSQSAVSPTDVPRASASSTHKPAGKANSTSPPLNNIESRILLWQKAANDIELAPIFGVGISRYNDLGVKYRTILPGVVVVEDSGTVISADNHAHNSWLHWWAETGTFGLFLMILFWLLVVWSIYMRLLMASTGSAKAFHLAMLSSLVGLFASSMFEHNMAAPSVMFMYTLFIGFYALSDDRIFNLGKTKSSPPFGNILWLNHRAGLGGGERVLLSYLRMSAIDKSRVRVVLLEDGDLAKKLAGLGYVVKVLSPGDSFVSVKRHDASFGKWVGQVGSLIVVIRDLVRYITTEDIGLVIGNSMKADMVGIIVGRITRRPVIVRLHDTIEVGEFNRKTYLLIKLLFLLGVDYFLPVSKVVDDSLNKMGIAKDRRQVIYNGVESPGMITSSAVKSPISLYTGQKAVILSRLIRHKGQHVVVMLWPSIVRRYPQAKLFLVGEGLFDGDGYEDYLKKLVDQLGMTESVLFTGPVDDIAPVLRDADVLIQPSLNPDPLPTALLEAIWHGVYAIASDSGGAKEIVTDPRLGVLYQQGNSIMLEEQIVKVLKTRPSTHKPPAKSSEFAKRFSLKTYVTNLDDAIEKRRRSSETW